MVWQVPTHVDADGHSWQRLSHENPNPNGFVEWTTCESGRFREIALAPESARLVAIEWLYRGRREEFLREDQLPDPHGFTLDPHAPDEWLLVGTTLRIFYVAPPGVSVRATALLELNPASGTPE